MMDKDAKYFFLNGWNSSCINIRYLDYRFDTDFSSNDFKIIGTLVVICYDAKHNIVANASYQNHNDTFKWVKKPSDIDMVKMRLCGLFDH